MTISRAERRLHKRYGSVAFVDEAGRGPLAGPVVASAVLVKNVSLNFPSIRDSKQLSERKREEAYQALSGHSGLFWGVASVSERVIDRTNILEATKLAMKRAVQRLPVEPDYVVIDGNFLLNILTPQKAVIRGDETLYGCMAAGILAKVTRDRLMRKHDRRYFAYGFARHKGYGTKYHLAMLKKHGPCPIHRMSFAPLRERGE